ATDRRPVRARPPHVSGGDRCDGPGIGVRAPGIGKTHPKSATDRRPVRARPPHVPGGDRCDGRTNSTAQVPPIAAPFAPDLQTPPEAIGAIDSRTRSLARSTERREASQTSRQVAALERVVRYIFGMPDSLPHRKRVRRREVPDGVRYVTFSCEQRLSLLVSASIRDFVREALFAARARFKFELFAYVIMPEHV